MALRRYGVDYKAKNFKRVMAALSFRKALKYKVSVINRKINFKPVNTAYKIQNFEEVVYALVKNREIVYIGKSGRGLLTRFMAYRVLFLIGAIDYVWILPIKGSLFCEHAEVYLIAKLKPRGNAKIDYGREIRRNVTSGYFTFMKEMGLK
jgi:hypothetical protein